MKFEIDENEIATIAVVTLSKRNLLTLLHKLNEPASLCRLMTQDCRRDGEAADNLLLIVAAEDDVEHYGKRGSGPRRLDPSTEAFLSGADGDQPEGLDTGEEASSSSGESESEADEEAA